MTDFGSTALPMRSRWPALVITVAARSVLVVLVSLLGWSLAPALFGWQPTVVMSASMAPKLVPGDIVVSRPISSDQLAIGQVLLVDSPDQRGELRLHRLARFGPNGTLILRGDANGHDDSSPVARSAVRGVGALHIPYLGKPYQWIATGDLLPVVLTASALLALLTLSFWWRPVPPADELGDQLDGGPPNEASQPSAVAEPTPALVPATPAVAGIAMSSRGLIARVLLVALTALVVVVVNAGGADATTIYTSKTTTTGSWGVGWYNCVNAVKGDSAVFALPLSEASGTTAADVSGNSANGTYSGSGVSYGVTGPCTNDTRTAVTLDGSAGKISQGTTPNGGAQTWEIWFKATSGSHGGGLLSTVNNGGNQTKMALAMTSTGTITFAVGGTSTVTTTSAYRDSAWHLATGVVTGSSILLYIDGANPISTASTANATQPKCTIGFDNHSDLNTGSFDYFQGSIAFAAAYNSALSAAQVSSHYAAAS